MSAEGKEETGQGGMALGSRGGRGADMARGWGGREVGRREEGGVLKERKKGEEGLIKG